MSRPSDGGQSSRTKSYSSWMDSRALRSRFSRENWLTSSISAPARSIVEGMADRPGHLRGLDRLADLRTRHDHVVRGGDPGRVVDAQSRGGVSLRVEVHHQDRPGPGSPGPPPGSRRSLSSPPRPSGWRWRSSLRGPMIDGSPPARARNRAPARPPTTPPSGPGRADRSRLGHPERDRSPQGAGARKHGMAGKLDHEPNCMITRDPDAGKRSDSQMLDPNSEVREGSRGRLSRKERPAK